MEQIFFATLNNEGLKVCQIDFENALPFILKIHYARRVPSISYAFGLFLGIDLIGVCTFGSPASYTLCKGLAGEKNHLNVLELNRLVILPEYNGKNYASYLVSHALKELPNRTFVVSYADSAWGHIGYVYQATNWLYTGKTTERTDIATNGHQRHYVKGTTERQFRSSKYRYVYLCGTKKQKRQMLKELKYPIIKEYPKGDTVHYDTKNPIQPKNNKG